MSAAERVELEAREVEPILRRRGFVLPQNVDTRILARWYRGTYGGYGDNESWVPLNATGGIATKPFHDHSVRFPKPIDRELLALLREGK